MSEQPKPNAHAFDPNPDWNDEVKNELIALMEAVLNKSTDLHSVTIVRLFKDGAIRTCSGAPSESDPGPQILAEWVKRAVVSASEQLSREMCSCPKCFAKRAAMGYFQTSAMFNPVKGEA